MDTLCGSQLLAPICPIMKSDYLCGKSDSHIPQEVEEDEEEGEEHSMVFPIPVVNLGIWRR